MKPAVTAERRRNAKLMTVRERTRAISHTTIGEFTNILERGDVVVVNDAATIPASLRGETETGGAVELRLARHLDAGSSVRSWQAVAFGAGDWRMPTEHRPPPPSLRVGEVLRFGAELSARIVEVSTLSPRLVTISFECPEEDLWSRLYVAGRPIQYSYHRATLEVWDQQTLFASHPVALEPPSALLHINWELTFSLMDRGVEIVPLRHATGIASTGDPAIDQSLPFPEEYWIPAATAAAVNAALTSGRRVVAVGTGTVRALESAGEAGGGRVLAGGGIATLKLGNGRCARIAHGLLTGMHEKGSSHLSMLGCFASAGTLEAAYEQASLRGYLWHEYGDLCLLIGDRDTR